jgi:hypothetical protein
MGVLGVITTLHEREREREITNTKRKGREEEN